MKQMREGEKELRRGLGEKGRKERVTGNGNDIQAGREKDSGTGSRIPRELGVLYWHRRVLVPSDCPWFFSVVMARFGRAPHQSF